MQQRRASLLPVLRSCCFAFPCVFGPGRIPAGRTIRVEHLLLPHVPLRLHDVSSVGVCVCVYVCMCVCVCCMCCMCCMFDQNDVDHGDELDGHLGEIS